MFMTLATSFVVLFNCYATADILTKFLQQCFLFFIVVVIPGQKSGERLKDHWSYSGCNFHGHEDDFSWKTNFISLRIL